MDVLEKRKPSSPRQEFEPSDSLARSKDQAHGENSSVAEGSFQVSRGPPHLIPRYRIANLIFLWMYTSGRTKLFSHFSPTLFYITHPLSDHAVRVTVVFPPSAVLIPRDGVSCPCPRSNTGVRHVVIWICNGTSKGKEIVDAKVKKSGKSSRKFPPLHLICVLVLLFKLNIGYATVEHKVACLLLCIALNYSHSYLCKRSEETPGLTGRGENTRCIR